VNRSSAHSPERCAPERGGPRDRVFGFSLLCNAAPDGRLYYHNHASGESSWIRCVPKTIAVYRQSCRGKCGAALACENCVTPLRFMLRRSRLYPERVPRVSAHAAAPPPGGAAACCNPPRRRHLHPARPLFPARFVSCRPRDFVPQPTAYGALYVGPAAALAGGGWTAHGARANDGRAPVSAGQRGPM